MNLFRTALVIATAFVLLIAWLHASRRHELELILEQLEGELDEQMERRLGLEREIDKQTLEQSELTKHAVVMRDQLAEEQEQLHLVRRGEGVLQENINKAENQLRTLEEELRHELSETAEEVLHLDLTIKARLAKLSREQLEHERLVKIAGKYQPDLLSSLAEASSTSDEQAATSASPPPPSYAIVYAVDGSESSWSSMNINLALLDAFLLSCYPHSVFIFADKPRPGLFAEWELLLPHASSVVAERVCFEECSTQTSGDAYEGGLNRFLSGGVYTHPKLSTFTSILFLRPTTFVVDALPEDPFDRFEASNCDIAVSKVPKARPAGSDSVGATLMSEVDMWIHRDPHQSPLPHDFVDSANAAVEQEDRSLPDRGRSLHKQPSPATLWASKLDPARVAQVQAILGSDPSSYVPLLYATSGWYMVNLELGRSLSYQALFHHLDASGGFYAPGDLGWSIKNILPVMATLFSSADRVCQVPSQRHIQWPIKPLTSAEAIAILSDLGDSAPCRAHLDHSLNPFSIRGSFT